MTEPIDFIICWVDDNDPRWQREKSEYQCETQGDNRKIRYRDWDNLQYWFRGVERFAPWVNKIHFVTWGHVPSWLNTDHPKINIVNHKEYIPEEYLPTFSARPIEVNLHRIKGLSEQFVYFNDDMFITKPLKKEDFFKKGLPCDIAALDIAIKEDEAHATSVFNSVRLINNHFNKNKSIKKDFLKWYNVKYGRFLIRTLLLTPWKLFTGFNTPHLPNAYLKKTFQDVWGYEYEKLHVTSGNKFRETTDVTQYLFKFWQLASGRFTPRANLGKMFKIGVDSKSITNCIEKQKYKIMCLNDNENITNFEENKNKIIKSFNKILKKKSSFEK